MSLWSDGLLELPFVEALKPLVPERSCELPRPELVLPDAPRPLLLDELPVPRVELLPMPSSPWMSRSVRDVELELDPD